MRTIIAPLSPSLPRPPPSPRPSGPINTLIWLIRGARAETVVQVGYRGYDQGWLSGGGLGTMLLRGLFATSQEWATSDPVWYVSFSVVYVSQLIHVFLQVEKYSRTWYFPCGQLNTALPGFD